jgi:predicted Fe-Mo cluster-binding NifX family protein
MNTRERKMLDLLKQIRDEYGVVACKAEFEAEGTRVDELLRLLELTNKADLKLGLKIGGCEAIRDLLESKSFGCDYIIAPMIESAYALKKFIDAKTKVYPNSHEAPDFLFNIETKTGFNNSVEIFDLASNNLDGCVFGRVDYTGSQNLKAKEINEPRTTKDVIEVAKLCVKENIEFVIGGGVSIDAISCLKEIRTYKLTRFETRKIIFEAAALDLKDISTGLLKAVEFELMWLKNKREFHEMIFGEDKTRIDMLELRWKKLLSELED